MTSFFRKDVIPDAKKNYFLPEINIANAPMTGESIIEMKKDHSTPIFRFLPYRSEITRDNAYQRVNMMVNQ